MDDKITIIEGPPPVFETIDDGWAVGLNEGPILYDTALTRVRTYNGDALVERCHRAWKENSAMYLHYRNRMGLETKSPILAARSLNTPDGPMLVLWVRRSVDEVLEDQMDDSDSSDHGPQE